MEIAVWVWIGLAFVLMPVLGLVFTKIDLSLDDEKEPLKPASTGETLGAAAVVASLWPVVLVLGVGFVILVWPTLAVIETTRGKHEKQKREAATEREVLAKIEAEQKAKDEQIKREIDGEPEPEPEPPFKRPQGRLRRSINQQFFADVAASEKRRVKYVAEPPDQIPSTLRRVNYW